MLEALPTVEALFAGKDPVVTAIYERLLAVLQACGPFTVEPKKSSLHLVRNSGFAGVHPRKSYLYLNMRLDHAIASARVAKTEQVSRNRYHNEIKLTAPDDVDGELASWLQAAYALG
ncbi:MAG TPA: DUF5655 domain-containing protein [Chloroflexia bacterium]|nr:DUF5655 domain-containing protein [Chloroflexia bacterium]